MLILIAKFVDLLTTLLSWGSFLVAGALTIVLFLAKKHTVTAAFFAIYGITFLIVRIFFAGFFLQWFPVIVLMITLISVAKSHYEDKIKGKRWWNW